MVNPDKAGDRSSHSWGENMPGYTTVIWTSSKQRRTKEGLHKEIIHAGDDLQICEVNQIVCGIFLAK